MRIVLVLHDIRSLHNVGSIFRTADAAGVRKIFLTGITPAPVDRFGRYRAQFAKVSLGAEKTVPWEKVYSAAKIIKQMRSEGYQIFAVEQSPRSVPYHKIPKSYILSSKFCLVFGNEVRGLPVPVLKFADKVLEISMSGKKESLNVSVAVGVVVFRLRDLPRACLR